MAKYLTIPGHNIPKNVLLALDEVEQEAYCERCWETTYFPSYKCRGCALYVPQEGRVWCIDCEYYTEGFPMGKCARDGSSPASGWSCLGGKTRTTDGSAK